MNDIPETQGSEPRGEDGVLQGLVSRLLDDLRRGEGEPEERREVEEWLRALAEKYPEFRIEGGLRDYYIAEAGRLRDKFDSSADLVEKLNLGRSIEAFLERATEIARRGEHPAS